MKKFSLLILSLFTIVYTQAQIPSNEIYLSIKKLNVLGSVLYIAAHPDDENNTLLPYLAKEKLFRTAYLSLTRGDGGQNLIGNEQGIELGLIRTQELLAARKIDGSEQYFSTAYEFGFSKSANETLKIWDKQKVLSDVVWVIRQFQPDIIITRFPPDKRAGHGHHAASAIIAQEAFVAAADPTKFTEQFNFGVQPWQAKRIVWNTFNFGNNNTTSNNQLKLDIGLYNTLLGKSYGEIGAEARTMHKSQGEGRPKRKGSIMEYFAHVNGDSATNNNLMHNVNITWERLEDKNDIQELINKAIASYNFNMPSLSIPALLQIHQQINKLPQSIWKNKKLQDVQDIIEAASGFFMEATTTQENYVHGDSLKATFFFNKRTDVNITVQKITLENFDTTVNANLATNTNFSLTKALLIANNKAITQPYWLQQPQTDGMFVVQNQLNIGKAENEATYTAKFFVQINGQNFVFTKPVQFKIVDPVKGEIYQPIAILPTTEQYFDKENYLSINHQPTAYKIISGSTAVQAMYKPDKKIIADTSIILTLPNAIANKTIQYNHIPNITYNKAAKANIVQLNLQTTKSKIGYIVGAGDKVPEALQAMKYNITFLTEQDITQENLQQYNTIITGIRAFNMYQYLSNKNEVLNNFVKNGGNLIVQYLKSNTVGNNKVKVGPYNFVVNASSRITEENAPVKFLLPNHSVLNYPNKISLADFNNWVQERSTYQAENLDAQFETPLAINDTAETESNGSLAIAKYGKGNFVYLSLVLFRQLPAGVPGAYKLLANIIALPQNK